MKNRRFCIACMLLLGLFSLTGYACYTVNARCARLLRDVTAVQGDAPAAIEQLNAHWQHDRNLLHLFLPSQQLADLNQSIGRLNVYAANDPAALQAEAAAIQSQIDWILVQERVIF